MSATPKTILASGIVNVTDAAAHDLFAAVPLKKMVITDLNVTNADNAVGTIVKIQDEDGVILWSSYAIFNGGGYIQPFVTPIKQPTANKKLQVICDTNSADVTVSARAYYI